MLIITDNIELVKKSKRLIVDSPSMLLDILKINNKDIPNLGSIQKSCNTTTSKKALSFIDNLVYTKAEHVYIINTKEFSQEDIEYIKSHYIDNNIVLFIDKQY